MESISRRLTSRAAITLYIIMASSYIVNAMDRQVFANLVKSINQELGLTIAQGGLLSTIFAVGFGITGFFAGYMLDKWARKTVMIAGILVYSLFTIAIGISTGFIDMGTFRILTGVGEAMQQTALFTIAGVVFASRRNLAIGGLNAAYGMGAFLGPVIGVQLFTASNSWRFPFYVFGIIGIVFAVILWFVLPKDFTEFAKEASTDKKAPVASAPIAESGTSTASWISKNLILLAIANGLISFSNFGYNGLYPTFLKSALTFSASDAAFAHGFYGIGAFTGIISGYLADKYGEKKILLFALVGSMANAYLMFNVLTVPWHQAV